MNNFQIRWKNFRGFKDTGNLTIKPITIIIGPNACGKTSLIAPILLLKQTLESGDSSLSLKTQGDLFDAGSFRDLIYRHKNNEALEFNLQFSFVPETEKTSLSFLKSELGMFPPGGLSVEFSANPDVGAPLLSRYLVRDIFGGILLKRELRETGNYSATGIAAKYLSKEPFYRAIRASKPEHFLFSAESAFKDFTLSKRTPIKKSKSKKEGVLSLNMKGPVLRYITAAAYIKQKTEEHLANVAYVGPLREKPRRIYEVTGETPQSVGTRGQHAPEILFRQKDKSLLSNVNKWVSRLDIGAALHCMPVAKGRNDLFELMLHGSGKNSRSPKVNFADTGFGLSQLLPLIVQGFYAKKNGLIIAEQPEIHLNPRVQSVLADIFVEMADNGTSVIAETHSEHLVLRLRRLVAEKKVKSDDVAIYYTEKKDNQLNIREIEIQDDGHIEGDDWPTGFFEDALTESLGLASAQLNSKNNA